MKRVAALFVPCLVATDIATSAPDGAHAQMLIETEIAVETGDGSLQKAELSLEPEFAIDVGETGRLRMLGRARVELADELEPGQPSLSNDLRSDFSRRAFLGETIDLELRELTLDQYVGNVFLRLGKQQIVWGQADGLRVLDIVNPFSFREFLLPEFEDSRIPLWSVQAEVPFGMTALQFIWIPDHSYDDIPAIDARFAFSSPRLVLQPPKDRPVSLDIDEPNRPDRLITDDDYGVKLSSFFGGWDVSLNYLYHFHDGPVLRRVTSPGDDVRITWDYERTHTVGASASNAFGDVTLRTEIAYSSNRFLLSEDPANRDGVSESGELGYVIGLDYRKDADFLVSGQLFQSILAEPEGALAREDVDTTVTLLLEREWRNDTVMARGLLLQSATDGDGQLQLEVAWRAQTELVFSVGVDVFYGDKRGLFGQFNAADRLTLGVEYGL